jgi:site-specific recombinase XerD
MVPKQAFSGALDSKQTINQRIVSLRERVTEEDVRRLQTHKPKSKSQHRVLSLALLILDTGLRIAEALALRSTDVDLDNQLLTVTNGKGRKDRVIPFSLAGRKVLYQLTRKGGYLFPTPGETLGVRNAQRDLTKLCVRAGITGVRTSPHTLRHSFAIKYLRNGGNLEYLRRILGHSSILVTQRYLQSIQPTDLRKLRNDLSPLGRSL